VLKGSTFKRCACKDPATGRELGTACPRLDERRHGSWGYAVWLDTTAGRRRLKRLGFDRKADAAAILHRIDELVVLAGDDHGVGDRIGDLVVAKTKRGGQLPTPDELSTRLGAGGSLERSITVGEWLDEWLAGKRTIRRTTRRSYEAHVRVHLKPRLAHIPLDRLRPEHVRTVFEAIEAANVELRCLTARVRAGEQVDYDRRRRVTGPATQQRIRATLRAALSTAQRRGTSPRTPPSWSSSTRSPGRERSFGPQNAWPHGGRTTRGELPLRAPTANVSTGW
jgi:hypothetical protein